MSPPLFLPSEDPEISEPVVQRASVSTSEFYHLC